jgi:SNF2 family DNA or RNA helicase
LSCLVSSSCSNQTTECKILRLKLLDVQSYDVVVTSYEMLKGTLESTFHLMVWRSVTLDEGHCIKNMLTQLSKTCVKLRYALCCK